MPSGFFYALAGPQGAERLNPKHPPARQESTLATDALKEHQHSIGVEVEALALGGLF